MISSIKMSFTAIGFASLFGLHLRCSMRMVGAYRRLDEEMVQIGGAKTAGQFDVE